MDFIVEYEALSFGKWQPCRKVYENEVEAAECAAKLCLTDSIRDVRLITPATLKLDACISVNKNYTRVSHI